MEKNFLALYAPSSSIARRPKEESHCAGSGGSYFFSLFPYFLQIPTNQTDCKILNQIYNFQFQCKPINPNRLLGFFWVKKRHVGGWRKRKRYLMEIGKKQVDEKKSEENKKLV